jgi:hypothetical protein
LKILKAQSQQKFVPSAHSYWMDAFSMKTQQFECVRLNINSHKLNKNAVYCLTDMGMEIRTYCALWMLGDRSLLFFTLQLYA